ncbi:MAG TPA: hypothetical protein VMS71_08370 [Candidatus Acidoferrum sp.]|nr:hypothetical protein [Candidatus Acidoferrum sp.]
MQKKIAESSAQHENGLGNPPGRKLFRVPSGQYCGRLVALIQTSPSELKLTCADAPFTSWSSLQTIISDASDSASDAFMDTAGNIHVVYSEQNTQYLVTRKLTFAGGGWTAGPKVTIFNGNQCFDPSIAIEPGGKLWVSWSSFTTPNRFIHVKSSEDAGLNWGSGPSDAGQTLGTASLSAFSKVVIGPNYTFVIYTYGGTGIAMRSIPIAGGSWSTEQFIATGSSGFTEHFDAAIGADGLLAVVFNDTMLRYREFDGINWGAVVTLDTWPQNSPQLLFRDNVPVVIYASAWSGAQKLLKYTERKSGSFTTPQPLDARMKPFDSVILYSQAASSYANVTPEAQNSFTGDIFHPGSSCLVKQTGDAIYLGMDRRFRYAELLLSTLGSGGTVTYSYWDGLHWQAFTPTNGASFLDSSDIKLRLWTDYSELPGTWQKCVVAGITRFWIKIEVVSGYTIGPIGSNLTAISELPIVSFRR